jgi:hypothetical protein
MMIPVVYNTGTHDIVKSEMLNRLLMNGVIAEFKRATGWVKVGSEPIRKIRQESYPEKFDRRHQDA